jgi:hypothetical protein
MFFFLLVELEDMFKIRLNLIWKVITLKMKKWKNKRYLILFKIKNEDLVIIKKS